MIPKSVFLKTCVKRVQCKQQLETVAFKDGTKSRQIVICFEEVMLLYQLTSLASQLTSPQCSCRRADANRKQPLKVGSSQGSSPVSSSCQVVSPALLGLKTLNVSFLILSRVSVSKQGGIFLLFF